MILDELVSSLKLFRSALDNYLRSDEILNEITELKKGELFKGKTGSGSDISPKYSEVPGFKFWYNEWKKRTIPTYKLDDIPDLYINGTFHDSLYTKYLGGGSYQTDSDYSAAFMRDVMAMHDKGDLLDLMANDTDIISQKIEQFIYANLII